MRLAPVPAGTFTMGSNPDEGDREPDEGPTRKVTITKPFCVGVFEVTQEQYETVMGSNPSRFKGPHRPVEGIWWSDAARFCERLSEKAERTVRLPTEAEWEYACRAGTTTRFCFGDRYGDLPEYAHYTAALLSSAPLGEALPGTSKVGSYKPNRWGLHDMHGNVFEWCSDWYRDSYSGLAEIDPEGAPGGAYRVLRGGSWASPPWQCRSAYRHRFTADGRFNHLIGFRVVVEIE
jgi:formylglycine-generating enzyme required for sulfatase activity